ncbi:MAG TPA: fibronectin type III domain-containing protein [Candidatus Thermoplasmatota archaeon]|jgi:hypothetical protein|nr:fibronectin type III domain-containing protein [Candidatus Thermoplasmatota archaeon]
MAVRFASLLLAVVLGVGVTALVPVSAHENNNHGTIKVHDDAEVSPPQLNDPHVACEFWIQGFNMAGGTGHLTFEQIPPTANPPVVVIASVDWTGTAEDDGDGFAFLAGPFNFTDDPGLGHYRVTAFLDQGHPGNEEHFAKQKVFWVDACGEEEGGGSLGGPGCPTGVGAVAENNGDITLSWDTLAGADGYNVYRREAGETDFNLIGTTTETTFVDSDTTVGVAYDYQVLAFADDVETEDCEILQATAVPFLEDALSVGLASLGGLAAFTVLRRRS